MGSCLFELFHWYQTSLDIPNIFRLTYEEQLKRPEWAAKRLEILERDGFKCIDCNTERPLLIGIIKSFGILTLEKLNEKGYRLFSPDSSLQSYENLYFIKDGWLTNALYMGDVNRDFCFNELLFSLQCKPIKTSDFLKNAYQLICFYKETIDAQNFIDLNVHHEYYIQGHKAWEYDNDLLVSLCESCHKRRHELSDYYVYSKKGDKLMILETCDKCGGGGHLKQFDYYFNGVCFQCWGEGVVGIEKT